MVVIKPAQCPHCQASLSGDNPQPCRHQVIELPPIKAVVTDYQQAAGVFRFNAMGTHALPALAAPVDVYTCDGVGPVTSRVAGA